MIVILKLTTKEFVMGKMQIVEEHKIELKDALKLDYYMSNTGYPSMYMTKYCMFVEGRDVSFHDEDVMHIFTDPLKDIVEYYNDNAQRIFEKPKLKPSSKRKSKKQNDNFETEMAMLERKLIQDDEVH
jgi:hypothetical protein